VPVLRERSPLPVIVDPSHGTGDARYVPAMAMAAMMAGADGLLIEVHADPSQAKCDGQQALTPAIFAKLMAKLRELAPLAERELRGAVGAMTAAAESVSGEGVPRAHANPDDSRSASSANVRNSANVQASSANVQANGSTRVSSGPANSSNSFDDEVIAP
jgi:hypothetical protein